MVEAHRALVRCDREWQEPAVGLELVDQVILQGTGSRVDGEDILQNSRAGGRRCGLAGQTRHRSPSQSGQTADDGLLAAGWSKDVAAGQKRNRSLLVLQEAFVGNKHEGPVFFDWEARGTAKLLAAQRILERLALSIHREWLAGAERLAEGKRITGVQSIITEEAIERAMQGIGPGLGDDVDRGAICPAERGRIVGAVDLKFLNGILAYIGHHEL